MTKQIKKRIIILIIIGLNVSLQAQDIDKKLCQEFLQSKNLYLIASNLNNKKLTTAKGESFTFAELVKSNFPDKKVITIDGDKYNKLEDLKYRFYIALTSFSVIEGAMTSTTNGILVQKGHTGRHPKRALYWINVNSDEVFENILPERLKNSVESLKGIFVNIEDGSLHEKYSYKTEGYKDILSKGIVYFRRSNLGSKYNSITAIKKYYSNKFKIVTYEEWANAIKDKTANILYLEKNGTGKYSAIDLYNAETGKLIIGTYPWIGTKFRYTSTFFKKMFK